MHATVRAPAALGLPAREETKVVSRDAFLSAMRRAASPVSVITTNLGGKRMALTVSSFLSVSADPPLISVCVNRSSKMCEAMVKSGSFGVHVLSDDQAHVADMFAGRPRSGEAYDFSCVDWVHQGEAREPLMAGVAIAAECSVVSVTEAGSHNLFISEVRNLITNEKRPLLYWNRLYGFPAHAADVRHEN
ncbi:flavin reductase family protein [Bradyrhizobium sp. Arg237L]|uniref:flavin reductase family protein n=2 Tax=unclassified Bradyrhizobium TaxID=2631580 RepID=UPI00249EB6A8|nr:flavin reductase family protein [Bradyrhizobium sp. Arg237L]MDI4234170.1 flavin reductase family protein [Bradyrhizobium sp. Arg237L]